MMKHLTSFLLILLLFTMGAMAQTLNAGTIKTLTGAGNLSKTGGASSPLQMMGLDPGILSSILGLSTGGEDSKEGAPTSPSLTNALTGALTPEFIQQLLLQRAQFDSSKIASDVMAIQRDSLAQVKERMNIAKSDIFGHDFFGSGRLALFERTTELKAPDNYLLDKDDELTISVWGSSTYNASLQVTQDGFISNPELGRIYVRGLSFGAAKALIRKRLSNYVNLGSSTLEVSLNYSRSISVNIVGEVNIPGTYRIPAINSIYNAINAAEGITEIGSVRNIEVRRGGKTVKRFDLYDFLMNGNESKDFYLQEGDFIYVPTASRIIDISGSIRRPKKYELIAGENFPELIRYAGGLAADAYTQAIQVRRFTGSQTEIVDANLSNILAGKAAFDLKDGDKIIIPTIPTDFDNFVSINGAIRFPGKYEFKEGYRVSDLVKLAGGVLYTTYLKNAFIVRLLDDDTKVNLRFNLEDIIINEESPENIILKKQDSLVLFKKALFNEQFTVSVKGSVKQESTINYTEGLTLNDILYYCGGFKQEAAGSKIEITRLLQFEKGEDGTADTLPDASQRILVRTIPISEDLTIDEASKKFELKPYDNIFVRKDFAFDSLRTVTLTGEVKFPGTYTILRKDERILDLIERAGGLTKYAHPLSAKLYRYDLKLGKVILELTDAFRDPESRANYILKEWDQIDIPTVNQVVSLKGGIRYPGLDSTQMISGRYIPGKRAKWYIKHYAGGFQKRARKKSTLAMSPNGVAGYTKFAFFARKYPKVAEGSVITVDMKPPKPPKEVKPKEALNWNIVLPAVITAVATTVSTMVTYFLLRK